LWSIHPLVDIGEPLRCTDMHTQSTADDPWCLIDMEKGPRVSEILSRRNSLPSTNRGRFIAEASFTKALYLFGPREDEELEYLARDSDWYRAPARTYRLLNGLA
jgi:hypothetical protein